MVLDAGPDEPREVGNPLGSHDAARASTATHQTLRQRLLGREGLGYLAATTFVNISNFAFHILVSHQLGPSSYGAVSALLNIVTFVSIPLLAFQAAVVVDVAKRMSPTILWMRSLLIMTLLVGVGITAVLMLASPAIAAFLGLGSILPVVVLSTWFVTTIPTPALAGASMGQFRFKPVAIATVAGAIVRILLTGLLGWMGVALEAPLIATAVGSAITLLALGAVMRPNLRRFGRRPLQLSGSTLGWTLIVLGGYSLLVGIDTILARHSFGSVQAGRYAAAATAAHSALFVAASIAPLVFPRFLTELNERRAKRELLHSSLLVGLAGLAVAGILTIFPNVFVGILFGARFQGVAPELRLLALESALLGIVNLVTYFLIARRSSAAFIPWVAVVALVGTSLTIHLTPEILAWAMLVVVTLCTLVMAVAAALSRTAAPSTVSPASTTECFVPFQAYDLSAASSVGQLDLSLVVPYYNPGTRLTTHVAELLEFLRTREMTFEIIAVSDGSSDGADQGLDHLGKELQVIRLPSNMGKGRALTIGFAQSRGRYVGFIDGDGDIPADALEPFVALIRAEQPEMVVASKWHPNSLVECSRARRTSSRAFQILVRLLLQIDTTDTQAGLKFVRRDLLLRALPMLEQRGFALDVEFLALARRMGYSRIVELPVQIRTRVTSSISVLTALSTVSAVVTLWWKLRVTDHYRVRRIGKPGPGSPSSSECAMVDDAGITAAPHLRILIFNWRDLGHPRAGGAEVWTHEVARAWVRRGCEVTVFCSSVAGRPAVESVDGVRYVRRGSNISLYRLARRYYRRECRGRFDLVIDEVNTRPFGCASWVRDTAVMSVVHQLAHEVWFYEMPLVMAMVGRLVFERRWLRQLRAAPIVTVSPSSKQSLEDLGLRDVKVVPEGFSADVIASSLATACPQKEAQPTLCWVGRLTPNKRPDHALRAFEAARLHLPDAQLWMIGSGPMISKLERIASDSVRFFGRVSDDEKHDLMARSHALLATSVREGWGLTVTEAAAVGTTTIGYAVPGLVDSIAASGGYLVPPSIEELGDEIVRRVPRIANGEDGLDVYPAGVLDWEEVAERVLASSPFPSATARLTERSSTPTMTVPTFTIRAPAHALPRAASRGFNQSLGRKGLSPIRWGTAGVGVVGLAAAAATARYGGISELLANIALLSLGLAAALLVVESRHTRDEASAWLPLRGSRWTWRIATIAVGLVSTAACQRWFSPAGAIAGGDVAPPIGTAWLRELFSPLSWSGSNVNGPAANETRAPWAGVLWVVHEAGGSAVLAERIWMTALFVGAALAALWLLRLLGCGPGAATLGSAAYLLNCYVVSSVAINAVYLAALALLPLFPAIVFAVARHRLGIISGAAIFLLSTPFVGYVYQNPPLVLLLVAALIASALFVVHLGGKESARRVGKCIALGGGLLIVGGLYWIVPSLIQVHLAPSGTLASTGSWTWTQGRATTANAFWLNTNWGWVYREYFPFAPAYSRLPLSLLRYLLPTAAFAVLLLPSSGRDRTANRRLALVAPVALGALLLIALSTGTNPPGSIFFNPLYSLPYGWLLREPGRFLMGAGLAYAVLLAVGVDALARGVRAAPVLDILGSGAIRRAAVGTAVVALVAILPGYPLVTGQIVPTSRGTLPSEHVNVPAYWQLMADAIDRAPAAGAVLMLPTDDFYQMPYKWGYYGSDTFSEDLISRPVLDPLGQGYTPATDQLLSAVQLVSQFALSHQWTEVNDLLDALHAPYVVVRGDINSSFPNRDITPPAKLAVALRSDPDMRVQARMGPLELFTTTDVRSSNLSLESAVSTPQNAPNLGILGLLPLGSALVTQAPQTGSPFALQLDDVDGWIMRNHALITALSPPAAEDLSLGVLETAHPALVPLADVGAAVPGMTVKELPGGKYRFSLAVGRSLLSRASVKNDGWGPVQDCNANDPLGAHLRATVIPGAAPEGVPAMQLSALADRACLQRLVEGTGETILVSLQSRGVTGTAPQICLWETPAQRCATLPSLSSSSAWSHYQAVVSIPVGQVARLFLYATPQGDGQATTSDFANVAVYQLPDEPPTLDLVGTPKVPATQGHLWVLNGGTGLGWRSTTGGRQVSVDGMLTGWIEPTRAGAPSVAYPLGHLVRVGQLVSLCTAIGALAFTFVWRTAAMVRRRRRPSTPPSPARHEP